jgi:hypothetical protein
MEIKESFLSEKGVTEALNKANSENPVEKLEGLTALREMLLDAIDYAKTWRDEEGRAFLKEAARELADLDTKIKLIKN